MAQSTERAQPENAAPPVTTHADDRELGFGAVDARPDVDGANAPRPDSARPDIDGADTAMGASEAAPGKVDDGGESGGGAYANAPTPDNQDHDGQSPQGYSGPANPNATSTREATHDRAA